MLKRFASQKLRKLQGMQDLLLWSVSACVWAYTSKSIHAYRAGQRHLYIVTTKFLERYPAILEQYEEFVKDKNII